jgi:transcriptional antiterminator NusG
MAKRWYVVHVFSGSEKRVAQAIREQAESYGLSDDIEEVLGSNRRRLLKPAVVRV